MQTRKPTGIRTIVSQIQPSTLFETLVYSLFLKSSSISSYIWHVSKHVH